MDSALIGRWNLDDVGPQILDSSGNGNHGTVVNATRVDGKVGKAYSFTNGSCITIMSSTAAVKSTGLTMLAWINDAGGCDTQSHGIIMNRSRRARRRRRGQAGAAVSQRADPGQALLMRVHKIDVLVCRSCGGRGLGAEGSAIPRVLESRLCRRRHILGLVGPWATMS